MPHILREWEHLFWASMNGFGVLTHKMICIQAGSSVCPTIWADCSDMWVYVQLKSRGVYACTYTHGVFKHLRSTASSTPLYTRLWTEEWVSSQGLWLGVTWDVCSMVSQFSLCQKLQLSLYRDQTAVQLPQTGPSMWAKSGSISFSYSFFSLPHLLSPSFSQNKTKKKIFF